MQLFSWLNRALVLPAFLLFLSGCASVRHQDFNAAANTKIREIGLVSEGVRNEYFINILHHPGHSFGLIGGLAALADTSSKTNRFTEAINRQQVDLLEVVKDQLSCLGQNGRFHVQPMTLQGLEKRLLLTDYSKLPKNVDAYLDVRLRDAGYMALYADSPYAPTLTAAARLVDARSQAVLYETVMYFGEPWIKNENLIHLAPDHAYDYRDFEHLMSQTDAAREGLKLGAKTLAMRICQDLQ